jgi:DNA-binding response OmpR family regulator/nitrogen-specific signal transduction histidine kinase
MMTELGLTGEIICFSLGLGYRFNELRIEEENANKLKALDEFKSKFYTNISHEFRTPLTVIQGTADLSQEYLQKGNLDLLRTGFDSIKRNSQNLLKLVNEMLDLTKLETKSMNLKMRQKDVVALLDLTLRNLESFASLNHVELSFNSEEEVYYMDMDSDKLQTVIINLISNAIKFTPDDGKVSLSLCIRKDGSNNKAIIKIEDTGYGIDPAHLPHIFDRYYQVDSGLIPKTLGSGVGLALVKELVHLMEGEITVQSKLGEGSQFIVSLPISNNYEISEIFIQEESELMLKQEIAQKQIRKHNSELPLLLLVEDNDDLRHFLVSLLDADYVLEIAVDGKDGLEKAQKLIPDIVISDVMMPVMDGLELCQHLKENEKTDHIPVILLTAKAIIEDRIKGLQSGADAYITKPFKKEELFLQIENLINLRSNLQKKYSQFALLDSPNVLKEENSFIHKINSAIEKNLLNEQFNVEDLAKEVYMSRMQLHRKLKAISDRSASNYIRNYRLYKAKPFLTDHSKTISEIAWDVGFQDPNYFGKAFQKEFGMSPSEFRNTNIGD